MLSSTFTVCFDQENVVLIKRTENLGNVTEAECKYECVSRQKGEVPELFLTEIVWYFCCYT